MTKPTLSILIATVNGRESALNRMLSCIQITHVPDEVEVIVAKDNFKLTVGAKRNILLEESTGDWTTFVDDDDTVDPRYCELIVDALKKHNPDQIGYRLKMYSNGRYAGKPTFHSMAKCRKMEWYETKEGYFRPTTHLNPIRSEISTAFKFPDISVGEDRGWSKQILDSGLLKTEHYIDSDLYCYYFNKQESTTIQGSKAQMPAYPKKKITMPIRTIDL
jgi:glycosyltransferase involved in cell wall biosynthesis